VSFRTISGEAGPDIFAIVGSGRLAHELAEQLTSSRAGRVVHYGSDPALASVRSGGESGMAGDAGSRGPGLRELARCTAVFTANAAPAMVSMLNELCLLSGVSLTVLRTDGAAFGIYHHAFGVSADSACHACQPRTAAPAPVDNADSRTNRTAASFALRVGLMDGGVQHSQRLAGSTANGTADTIDLPRNPECTVCAVAGGPGLIVRTHNRWGTATCLQRAGPAALEQVLRLSDALITDVRCGACGALPHDQAAHYLNRRAADVEFTTTACAGCGVSGQLECTSSRQFSVAELAARFGEGAAPITYAYGRIAGKTICFDLQADCSGTAYRSLTAGGALTAGAGAVTGAAGVTFNPEDD